MVRHARLVTVWAGLVLATVLLLVATPEFDRPHIAVAFVMVVAFAKAFFVVWDFMEVRTAPTPLRLFFLAWLSTTCLLIISLQIAMV